MSSSAIDLFGRAWKLSVKNTIDPQVTPSEVLTYDKWDPEALRMTFEVQKSPISSPFWGADITIYNLSDATTLDLIRTARWVTLEAGYQFGAQKSTVIWDGPVLQVMFGRENVVDNFVRFNCVSTLSTIENDFVSMAVGPNFSQLQAISKMIGQKNGVTTPTQRQLDQQISPTAQSLMSQKTYPAGKTFFGNMSTLIDQIAKDNGLQHWIGPGGADYISEMLAPDADQTPEIVYTPPLPPVWTGANGTRVTTRSIIGVPTQNPFGVDFTVLLDPRLTVTVPPMIVQIDNAIIQQMKIQYGQLPPTPLDANGVFVVSQITHRGDTRGQAWYTDVVGFTPLYAQGLLQLIYNSASGRSEN